VKDLTPVTLVADVPKPAGVNPSVPAKNVAELVAYAKANPGVLNFATDGIGSAEGPVLEMGAVQETSPAICRCAHFPNKGRRRPPPALNGMLGGETQATIRGTLALPPPRLRSRPAGPLKAFGVFELRCASRCTCLHGCRRKLPTSRISSKWLAARWRGFVRIRRGTPARGLVDKLHAALAHSHCASPQTRGPPSFANGVVPVSDQQTHPTNSAHVGRVRKLSAGPALPKVIPAATGGLGWPRARPMLVKSAIILHPHRRAPSGPGI
jgi:hypothetical protein